jgi:hypothetical protein
MRRHAPCAEEAAALVLTARALTDVNEAAGFGTCTHQAWERQISTIPRVRTYGERVTPTRGCS